MQYFPKEAGPKVQMVKIGIITSAGYFVEIFKDSFGPSANMKQIKLCNTCTLRCESVFTPRAFSTKTQDFTPMFLKPVVEVQVFL